MIATDSLSLGGRLRAGFRFVLTVAIVALTAAATAHAAIDEDDLLPVDQAFVLSAAAIAPDRTAPHRIGIRWKIADGYYLYRHRTSVQAGAGFAAQPLQLPRGKAYEDEFFGKVETYRGALTATLPGTASAGRVTLTVKYQGCADLGICYPPQTRELVVSMPDVAMPGAAALPAFGRGSAASSNPLFGGNRLLGNPMMPGTDPLPLPPEQAFGFEAIAGNGNTLLLRFTPAPGYYLYRDKTTLRLDGPVVAAAGIRAGAPQWPRGVVHRDEYFGATTVFFEQIDVPLPLQRTGTGGGEVRLTAGFQGCQDDGICYPPMTRTVVVALPAGNVAPPSVAAATAAIGNDDTTSTSAASSSAADTADARDAVIAAEVSPAVPALSFAAATAAITPDTEQAEDSRIAAALSGPNRWWALLSFFGFGLLLAFTPCVLPMIPILSGLIAGAAGPGKTLGARRAFALSLVYVLANALVFTVAGVVAGLIGANLQIAFQAPWVIVAFALLFVALALSSFGLFELQLPASLRSRLGALSDRQRGGSWPGVAAMGALSALIVGPCVAPPLAAAVLYIGQTQDPAFGGAALFLLAMGMGVPLIAFGMAAGKGLPTSGPWMTAVQRAFGFVFLGLAVWMLSRILPGPLALALWGVLLLGAAAMAGLAASRPAQRNGLRATAWTLALLLGTAGLAQVVGALAGSRDPLQPLAGLRGGVELRELPFRRIKSVADLDREVASAQAQGVPLMLDFYADWCVSCKEMEKYTFPQPAVHEALAGFVLLKADVTANDALDQALMKRLAIIGPPATLYYVDGVERRELRLFGFEKAAPFAQRAARAQTANAASMGSR